MLQSIRDKSQGWFAWIVVGAVCVTFALWGVHSYLYGSSAKDMVAKVNGVNISRQDFLNLYNKLKRQQQMNLAANYVPTKQSSEQLKKAALHSLVSSIVLNQAASSDGFSISSMLVSATLAKMPIFQVNGVFLPQRFQEVVSGMLYTMETFSAQLRSSILGDQIKSGFVETAFALPCEVNQAVRLINQKRKFAYFIVSVNRFLSKITLPLNAARDYYKQHQDEFKTSEKVNLEYLQLSVNQLMKKIRPTDQELKQFYQNNLFSYTQTKQLKLAVILITVPQKATKKQLNIVKGKIKNIETKLKQGKNFGELAKQYSDDVQTANQDGVIPSWVTVAQLNAPLRQGVAQLSRVGDVSRVIQTARGYEIIKLLNVKPQKVLSFSAVKHKVLLAYQQKKAEAQFSNLNDQLANMTYENPNSLKKASKTLGLPIQTTGLFSRENLAPKGILKNPQIVTAAFSDDVLVGNNNSDPINLGDNSVIVLRIKQHKKASVKIFNIVKTKIENKLRQQMSTKKVEDFSNQLLKTINAGKSIESVAKQNGLSTHIANYVLNHAKRIDPAILDAVFKLSPSAKKTSMGNVIVNLLTTKGFALVSLLDVKDGNVQALPSSKKRMFTEATANSFGISDYQLYIDSLMQKAKIKYTNSKTT